MTKSAADGVQAGAAVAGVAFQHAFCQEIAAFANHWMLGEVGSSCIDQPHVRKEMAGRLRLRRAVRLGPWSLLAAVAPRGGNSVAVR